MKISYPTQRRMDQEQEHGFENTEVISKKFIIKKSLRALESNSRLLSSQYLDLTIILPKHHLKVKWNKNTNKSQADFILKSEVIEPK